MIRREEERVRQRRLVRWVVDVSVERRPHVAKSAVASPDVLESLSVEHRAADELEVEAVVHAASRETTRSDGVRALRVNVLERFVVVPDSRSVDRIESPTRSA